MKKDPQLIRETLAGNTRAFDQLVQKYQDRLLNALVHVLGNYHDAQDDMQEAFRKVYMKLGTFKGESSFYTWLYRIAINTSISRRRQKRPVLSTDQQQEASGEEPRDETESVEESILRKERIRQTLAPLNEEQRLILKLYIQEGYSFVDIGKALDKKANTVQRAYLRTRKKVLIYEVANAIRSDDLSILNSVRLNSDEANGVTQLCREDPDICEALEAVFTRKSHARAIQNVTWILACMAKQTSVKQQCEDILVRQLVHGDLFRGNKNYLSEALLDVSYHRHIWSVRSKFILCLDEFEDRITSQNAPSYSVEETNSRCIYDVKRVVSIGEEVKAYEVEHMLKTYKSGSGSIDYRRNLAFELTRLHRKNEAIIRVVVEQLRQEQDQTNAYYVVKYLTKWGRQDHPSIYGRRLSKAVDAAAQRWPKNKFLAYAAKKFWVSNKRSVLI